MVRLIFYLFYLSLGQGDCDNDNHCMGNLKCGDDNCKQFNPTAQNRDCCSYAYGKNTFI